MIIVTGASGFIGSCLIKRLNEEGFLQNIVVVDDFYKDYKDINLEDKNIRDWIHRDLFLDWFKKVGKFVDFVFHIGARTDTAEQDWDIFEHLNLGYSKAIWKVCAEFDIPLIYASSAATYGDGKEGFEDHHSGIKKLKPLNPYGKSKQDFDVWALSQKEKPSFWAGLKFFNVYGPNEYHKKRMASVVFHATNQIQATNKMKLFRSHRADISNGEQKRDFIYVKDVLEVCMFMMQNKPASGLYNLGTGEARSFLDLTSQIFKSLGKKEEIEFIDIPNDIRNTYQYFTEANMKKLKRAGYNKFFTNLEAGVDDYVGQYLLQKKYY